MNAPKRISPRPKVTPPKQEVKRAIDGKGILIAVVIAIATIAISMNRDVIMSRKAEAEEQK